MPRLPSFDIDGNSRTGDSREYDSHDYRLYYRGWNHEGVASVRWATATNIVAAYS